MTRRPGESVEEFRRAHAALNRTTPPVPPPVAAEALTELSRQHENLAEQVKAMVAQADAREAAARKAARPRPPRRPLAWSAALVLMVLLLCALAAWLGWLWLGRP